MPGYISNPLAALKAGAPKDEPPLMMPQALPLGEEGIHDLDACYAPQKPVRGAIPATQAEAAKAGGRIHHGGYNPYRISACMRCRGPSGHGIPPKFPRVAGQPAVWPEKQPKDLKKGARKHKMMSPIACALPEDQIGQLALLPLRPRPSSPFTAGLHPVPPCTGRAFRCRPRRVAGTPPAPAALLEAVW